MYLHVNICGTNLVIRYCLARSKNKLIVLEYHFYFILRLEIWIEKLYLFWE